MKNFLFFLLLLCFIFPAAQNAQAQVDYEGNWVGTITQIPAGLAYKYDFSLSLKEEDGKIVGLSTIRMRSNSDYYGTMLLTGSIDEEGSITLEETEIIEQYLFSLAYWCKKDLFLKVEETDEGSVLKGYWLSEDCPTSDGEMYLKRMDI